MLHEFYKKVISSKETACVYFMKHGLLVEENSCRKCDGPAVLTNSKIRRQDVPVWRCRRKGCQSVRSVRKKNEFFHCSDLHGRLNYRLKLCEFLELVSFWSIGMTLEIHIVSKHVARCCWWSEADDVASSSQVIFSTEGCFQVELVGQRNLSVPASLGCFALICHDLSNLIEKSYILCDKMSILWLFVHSTLTTWSPNDQWNI